MRLNNVLIFGDSYSTFEGYIPEGYDIYYSEKGNPDTDVRKVTETWWHQVISETDSSLILNDRWSGSTICYTGYDNADCSESSSFICRFRKLLQSGFFDKNPIDTVFVFGGTNDSWANAPIGSLKFADWEKKDLYFVLPAVSYFLKILKDNLPETRIICLINTELKPEISDGMKNACKHYGIQAIAFEAIDKTCGHPTVKGMQDIKDQILSSLNKQ